MSKKQGVKWDEEVIAEHDKLRGTRMKIEEPNTPYNHEKYDTSMGDEDGEGGVGGAGGSGSGSGSGGGGGGGGGGSGAAAAAAGLDSAALHAKLAAVEMDDTKRDQDETLEQRRKREKKKKFKGKMNSHYGGMGALLRKGATFDDDEDES